MCTEVPRSGKMAGRISTGAGGRGAAAAVRRQGGRAGCHDDIYVLLS